jgi:hypothetical protein
MKKYAIEIKWGIIFVVVALLWMVFEKSMGWHDVHIDKHATYTNFFAIPAIAIYVLALLDKRNNFYSGKMTWLQGFLAGVVISLIVLVFSPLSQLITHKLITPDYFQNAIDFTAETGRLTREKAEEFFNLKSYMIQSAIGAVGMGVVTSAVVAIFTKRK